MTERAGGRTFSGVSSAVLLVMVGLICIPFADLELTHSDFHYELSRFADALVAPAVDDWSELLTAVLNTLSFAFQGVAAGFVIGFLLSLVYQLRWIRLLCAFVRAIHELFWALIFIQIVGLSPLAGMLAIAVPFAGTFAKVFGEIYEETDRAPSAATLNRGLASFFYTTLPLSWQRMVEYSSYRFECGIRASAVLGFVGLPTIGFHMETLFRQGHYHQGVAMLYALFILVGSTRLWLRAGWIPLYVLLALLWLPPVAELSWPRLWQFFSFDIVPAPLRTGHGDTGHGDIGAWLDTVLLQQAGPGIVNTVLLTQIALALTLVLALLLFPLRSRLLVGRLRYGGHGVLVVLRTTPEYLLAFLGVIVLGPSMIPGILALGLHNAGILAHLSGRFVDQLRLREDAPAGVLLYFYELLPRIYRQFLALLLYRWEVIQRESAILGVLGITTLGFYIDSAFEELRMDRAMVLIVIAAALNMSTDSLARYLRGRNSLHL